MATDTTHNVGLTSSTEIVASLKNENEVLIYPKTVAQSVTVMKAGYTDGSTTQTLAERLAALDTTDDSLSESISSLESTLTSTAEMLQEEFDELAEDIGEIENMQQSITTNSLTSLATSGTTSVTGTYYKQYTEPVEVTSVSLRSAVLTLAQYCHKHTSASSASTFSGSCSSYCSCDCNDCCNCRGE